MSRIFTHTKRARRRNNVNSGFCVERYIQNINPMGKNKSTGYSLSTYYVLIVVLITTENSVEV